jgi:hypothetical protein
MCGAVSVLHQLGILLWDLKACFYMKLDNNTSRSKSRGKMEQR